MAYKRTAKWYAARGITPEQAKANDDFKSWLQARGAKKKDDAPEGETLRKKQRRLREEEREKNLEKAKDIMRNLRQHSEPLKHVESTGHEGGFEEEQ